MPPAARPAAPGDSMRVVHRGIRDDPAAEVLAKERVYQDFLTVDGGHEEMLAT